VTPSLAILELSSIARGVVVSDAVVKRAPVTLLQSRPVSSGKHVLIFGGQVAPVEESVIAGRAVAGDALIDELFLPLASPQIGPLLAGNEQQRSRVTGALAIIETTTVCAAVLAADAATKTADVRLLDLRLAVGIGGKAFFTIVGELFDLEAAVDAGVQRIDATRLIASEIIAAPHDDLQQRLLR